MKPEFIEKIFILEGIANTSLSDVYCCSTVDYMALHLLESESTNMMQRSNSQTFNSLTFAPT